MIPQWHYALLRVWLRTGAYDPKDQLERFVHWRDKGYMSSNGRCFDIGTQTSGGLHDYECTGEPYRADTSSHKSG
jgi:ADP-ribosyl-[dinitrogen reductase] hydrolase